MTLVVRPPRKKEEKVEEVDFLAVWICPVAEEEEELLSLLSSLV